MTDGQNNQYYYEIDILRGLSCLVVYFSHLWLPFMEGPHWDIAGRNGVYVFFVISGFIITKSFSNKVVQADSFCFDDWSKAVRSNVQQVYQFWHRRFLRLFPGLCCLLCCLAIITAHYGVAHGMVFEAIIEYFRLVSNFFLLDNCMNNEYNHISQLMYWKVGVMWSLDCEILFYIIFPFIIIFKKIDVILFPIFIFIFITKSLLYPFVEFKYLYYGLLANFDFFIAGVLIAKYQKKIGLNKKLLIFLVAISIYSLIFTTSAIENYRFYLTGMIVSVILVYTASLNLGILKLPYLGAVLHFVGVRSYFIYLMHVITYYMLEISILDSMKSSFPIFQYSIFSDYLNKILFLALIVLLAGLFYKYVEKPFMQKYKNSQQLVPTNPLKYV